MLNKKKKMLFGVVALVAVLMTAVYFSVPKMMADELIPSVYPLKYTDFIVKYSTQYGVDPALVAAVIFQESRFNPKAASGAGAQGLMQFMPGTAQMMAKETGHWPKYDIWDPETSVEFGAAHLRDLLNKYNGDEDQALAGYNAGTGTVDSWIRLNIFDRIIGSNSKSETVNYVKKVKNYQTVYSTMYASELRVKINADLRQTTKADQDAQVRGLIWTQIFSNIISIGKL